MKKILSAVLPVGASIPTSNEEIEYSFASEYEGPPLTHRLPRAIPLVIKSIPVASEVSPTSKPNKIEIPIVEPLPVRDPLRKIMSDDVDLASETVNSPISVIRGEGELSREYSSSGCQGSTDGHSEISNAIDDQLTISDESVSGSDDNLGTTASIGISEFSSDSASCSELTSSEVSSQAEEESGNVNAGHVRRESVVTFHEDDSVDTTRSYATTVTESEYMHGRKQPEKWIDNGLCKKCAKGNRFTEKETCLVCNAKYCISCVLGGMGSMPEGRKCVNCISFPIDESKRRRLGKCSRMLKRLLSESEIRQIMEVERWCENNQLQARLIYVNGKKLSPEELILLQNCPKPPMKLKPGEYWYDNVSGLWGEVGHKPCKIISPHLNVGGRIMQNASNGNTKILINNREITKVELRLLKLAGVQCAGNPHFWLDEYGSYREEGQKNEKGKLWDKVGAKLLCAVLSLPTPNGVPNPSAEEVNKLVSGVIPEYMKQRARQKLLLVGYNGSGTTTIFKQAKMQYNAEPFTEDELQKFKFMIQRNVYSYLAILLEGRKQFEEELLEQPDNLGHDADEERNKSIYSISPKLKAFADWLLEVKKAGNLGAIFPAASREYAPLAEELWKDAAIKATLDRKNELKMLPSVASYFLEQVIDISRTDYQPSHMDILYAEGPSSYDGVSSMDFSIPRTEQQGGIGEAVDHPDAFLRYQLLRVDARSLGGHCKWLQMFEDVRMVLFCVSLSDYDQLCEDHITNKILASKKIFEEIVSNPKFEGMEFLLILTKYDLLEEKIERVPLSVCTWFDDFTLVRSNYQSNNKDNHKYIATPAEQGFHYIASKFKKRFHEITGRKLYVSLVNGLEPETINGSLKYAREILKWDEDRIQFNSQDLFSNTQTVASIR